MRTLFTKLTGLLLIVSITFAGVVLSFPQKADAQWLTFDAANTAQGTITAANTSVSSYGTMSLQLLAYVLNPLATALAKQLIRQITASVVQWINGGFEGNPSFVTNPGGFLLDVADQTTGEFLAKNNGPLNNLCSEFSIDIRLALAFKYHPNIPQRYQCTLGTIIKNTKNAVLGATINGQSINGFVNGDFSQGGWPAFVSLTTEPQNNIYGAYLTADSELSMRVAGAQADKKSEVDHGNGFLSWRNPKCKADVKAHNDAIYSGNVQGATTENYALPGDANFDPTATQSEYYNLPGETSSGGGEANTVRSVSDCPIETPGSLIASTLGENANGPLHELQLVDSINQVVNALAAQMINTILQGGLRAISGSGPSDSTAYINRVSAEARAGTPEQLTTVRNGFIQNVETYIQNALQFKLNKDQSLSTMLDVKASYDKARDCYTARLGSGGSSSLFQSKIDQIDQKVASDVTPLSTQLFNEDTIAADRYKTLASLRDQANAAQTVNDLNGPSQAYSKMLQDQSLVTPKDVVDSKQQLDSVTSTAKTLKDDATRKYQECQITTGSGSTYGTSYGGSVYTTN
jgi:hypothetical protein